MAPLITHLWIAEQTWPLLAEQWGAFYGDFLFGNLAVDVDKFCPELEQETTHLVAKDETDAWLTQRSRRFIDRQAKVLRAPFSALEPTEQAFVLGYVLHLAADEATTSRFEAFRAAHEGYPEEFASNETIAVVIDQTAAGLLRDRDGILTALGNSRVPKGLVAFIPDRCLEAMRWIVFPLIQEGGGIGAYIKLVRRNSLWHRHRQISEEPVDEDLEEKLVPYRQKLLDSKVEASTVARQLDIEAVVSASIDHCQARLLELVGLA
jgi:hypothetical protein